VNRGYLKWLCLLQSTVRDLFSVNANDADFEEMVSADKNKEEQPAKKNAKSQNAFEEVCRFTYQNLYLCKPNGNAERSLCRATEAIYTTGKINS
jgi:hypothetical protein